MKNTAIRTWLGETVLKRRSKESARQKMLVDQYSGFLNLFTPQAVAMYEACVAGDVAQAREIWQWLLPFKHLYSHQILGSINDIAIYRAGLEMLGEVGGYSRAPFNPLTANQRSALQELMQKQGMLA